METQGLPTADGEAARPEPGARQHGGGGGGADDDRPLSSAPSPARPARRSPQRRDSAAASGGGGPEVTFPVLLLLEGEKPPEPPPLPPPPPPPFQPPKGPAAAAAFALQPGAGGPAAQQDSDALLLVLNLVRGGGCGGLSGGGGGGGGGPPQEPPLPPPQPEKAPGGGRGGREAPFPALPEGPARPQKPPPEDSSFSGTLTIHNQSLVVRFENGLLSLGAPPPPPPQPPSAAEPAALMPRPAAAAYSCPEPRCAQSFPRKQLLRLHRLSAHDGADAAAHRGGGGEADASAGRPARPFRCPVPGCAWAFATAYKLRRHQHSHDKLRPFACPADGCAKRFTTVYNLRAHGRAHEQEAALKCEACGQRCPSAARLAAHRRRSHLEPHRPYRCEYPGCDRTFITVSALFSHNRVHFREQELFSCSFPGCSKQYDKACRLKIHMRSHTGERPFICDFEGCGWSFTSMSKLLRHKRKHEDDRRFTCSVEGCGKSFTRAEHLKGHSITHLGTKPFECPVEGCCAKFSARSSLYIHSKKHLQDVESLKTRCPVSSCNKLFTSKHSMKTHMVKQHNFSADLLNQMETISSLTPSSELTNSGQSDLSNIDLVSLFSSVSGNSSGISTDMALINSGILTIDVASVGSTLGGSLSVGSNSLGQTVDPLILVTSGDIPHSLDSSLLLGTNATVLQQSTLNLEDVQTVNAEALGSLASLSAKNSSQELHGLTSSNNLSVDTATLTPSSNFGGNNAPELLAPIKAEQPLLPSLDVVGQQEGSKVVTQFVFSNPPGSYSAQKETDLSMVTGSSFLESGGSARTDYRAIQLAKKRKQKGNESDIGSPTSGIRKGKGDKIGSSHGTRLCNSVLPNGGLPVRDPSAGSQYGQIQLLQDDSPGEGDLPFQLSSQSSSSHSQLTVDLPVHILQEPHNSNEDDASSDNSQFTGSTINLQDLE
uniref:zinc finger protein ZXDC n=1 Tax=Euleptes europaea TaxID=460621 RepID=UPI0025421A6A|nr:zinc finger protein ZXDC [Euleptes europaea]